MIARCRDEAHATSGSRKAGSAIRSRPTLMSTESGSSCCLPCRTHACSGEPTSMAMALGSWAWRTPDRTATAGSAIHAFDHRSPDTGALAPDGKGEEAPIGHLSPSPVGLYGL